MTARGSTFLATAETLVTETCYSCGVVFAMPVGLQKHRLADKANFWCPNGHSQSYTGKTDAELRKEAERALANAEESRRIAWANAEARRQEAEAERKRHAATKGKLTRERKKTKGGVCPADGCHRHFVDLQRHMNSKHPGLVPDGD